MKVVIDTSAVLAVVLSEPERGAMIAATRGCDLYAPAVLPYEIGNALTALCKRKLLNAQQMLDAWAAFAQVPIDLANIDMPAALAMAGRHGIYAYDAYVMQSALEQRAELLTLDKRMRTIAPSEGITLRGVSVP